MSKQKQARMRRRRSAAAPPRPTVQPKPARPEFNRQMLQAILACAVLGVVLRALHLGIPMRYDEAHTFMKYALHGWEYSATTYNNPNNHVLHTLLVVASTKLFGESPFAIRLPAFLAGCFIPLASAWLAWRAQDEKAALVAAALSATWPVLISYSTNARGYSLVVLLSLVAAAVSLELVRTPTSRNWLILGVTGVAGLYT